jgi:hypothetical protein
MHRTVAIMIAVALAGGCSKPRQGSVEPSGALRNQPAPVPRLRPAIDPKSSEAAELLVGSFVKLLNQGRFGDAYMLLGPGASPRTQFETDFAGYSHLNVIADAPGDREGAAGSIYLSVPLRISGRLNGRDVERRATAVVRRVNDVPGSSEAERRWHIERIDWKKAD